MVGLGEGSKIMKYLRIERGHIMPEINETYKAICPIQQSYAKLSS